MSVTANRPRFSTGEVARLLGVTRQAISIAEKRENIPPTRRELGGDDRVFYAEDIDELRRHFRRR